MHNRRSGLRIPRTEFCLALDLTGKSEGIAVLLAPEAIVEIRSREGKINSARIMYVSQVCLYGGAEISTPAVVELMQISMSEKTWLH